MNSQREDKYSELKACLGMAAMMPADPRTKQMLGDAKQAIEDLQAATEQGVGEAVGEIAISNNGNTAQLFYSSSAIKALGLEDGSFIDVYTHPPKPTGGEPHPTLGYVVNHTDGRTEFCWTVADVYRDTATEIIPVIRQQPTGGGVTKSPGLTFAQRSLSKNIKTWPNDAHSAITDTLGESCEINGWVRKYKLDQVVASANRFEDVQAETIQRLRDDLRTAHLYQSSDEDRPVWYWQGDGYDHPESLVNDAVVVIRADQLRALLATQQPPEQE